MPNCTIVPLKFLLRLASKSLAHNDKWHLQCLKAYRGPFSSRVLSMNLREHWRVAYILILAGFPHDSEQLFVES